MSFTLKRYRTGWAVYDPLGRRASGTVSHPIAANIAAKMARETKFRTRKCLRCSEMFMSEGPHNRMCPSCRRCAREIAPDMVLNVEGFR